MSTISPTVAPVSNTTVLPLDAVYSAGVKRTPFTNTSTSSPFVYPPDTVNVVWFAVAVKLDSDLLKEVP